MSRALDPRAVATGSCRSAAMVDVATVLDGDDLYDQPVVLDPVEHPVVAATHRAQWRERLAQRLAQSLRIARKRPVIYMIPARPCAPSLRTVKCVTGGPSRAPFD